VSNSRPKILSPMEEEEEERDLINDPMPCEEEEV